MFKGRTKARHGPVQSSRRLFHGVSIRPGDDCVCGAVEARLDERILSEDAPLLPLDDCDNPGGCRCVYEHFDDRRTSPRRESDVGLPLRDVQIDVRDGVGRRITDG